MAVCVNKSLVQMLYYTGQQLTLAHTIEVGCEYIDMSDNYLVAGQNSLEVFCRNLTHEGECLSTCPTTHYPLERRCQPCPKSCLTCLNDSYCTSCNHLLLLIKGKCGCPPPLVYGEKCECP